LKKKEEKKISEKISLAKKKRAKLEKRGKA
jgi:hypothetical protein